VFVAAAFIGACFTVVSLNQSEYSTTLGAGTVPPGWSTIVQDGVIYAYTEEDYWFHGIAIGAEPGATDITVRQELLLSDYTHVSITHSDPDAFRGNTDLITITWDTLQIWDDMFSGCTSLSAFFYINIYDIPDRAFFGCFSLTSFSGNNTINHIGDQSFSGTQISPDFLISLDQLRGIGDEAFSFPTATGIVEIWDFVHFEDNSFVAEEIVVLPRIDPFQNRVFFNIYGGSTFYHQIGLSEGFISIMYRDAFTSFGPDIIPIDWLSVSDSGLITGPVPYADGITILIVVAEWTGGQNSLVQFIFFPRAVPHGDFLMTFDSMGGSPIPPQAVQGNTTAAPPADPVREGYAFAGWFADPDLTEIFSFATLVTTNITLYAGWTREHTVTFVVDYEISFIQIVESGMTVDRPADPVREGHTFEGWFEGILGEDPFNFEIPITSDLTLYAGWDAVGYPDDDDHSALISLGILFQIIAGILIVAAVAIGSKPKPIRLIIAAVMVAAAVVLIFHSQIADLTGISNIMRW